MLLTGGCKPSPWTHPREMRLWVLQWTLAKAGMLSGTEQPGGDHWAVDTGSGASIFLLGIGSALPPAVII